MASASTLPISIPTPMSAVQNHVLSAARAGGAGAARVSRYRTASLVCLTSPGPVKTRPLSISTRFAPAASRARACSGSWTPPAATTGTAGPNRARTSRTRPTAGSRAGPPISDPPPGRATSPPTSTPAARRPDSGPDVLAPLARRPLAGRRRPHGHDHDRRGVALHGGDDLPELVRRLGRRRTGVGGHADEHGQPRRRRFLQPRNGRRQPQRRVRVGELDRFPHVIPLDRRRTGRVGHADRADGEEPDPEPRERR